MMRRSLVLVALVAASPAHAGDKPLYQPVPAWVKPAPAPAAQAQRGDAPTIVISDVQARLGNGESWTYVDRALRLDTIEAVSRAGTIKLEWQPAHGDLIIHTIEIVRGGERIDALKAARVTVIRREQGLEKMAIDGELTATLAVEGLRVGDIMEVRYSRTNKDPSLAGNSVAEGPLLSQPAKVGFARTRLLWPGAAAVHWKAYPVGATPVEGIVDGWHDLTFNQPLARQPDPAPDAPGRYARPPLVEASTFADWAAVSKVMAPLYRTDGLIAAGSPLAAEVARIAAAERDPRHRVAAALALVQQKVRYLFNGMDNGNYVPQPPAETWKLGYGDCKAKTLLLLAVLRDLGIEAEPALANIGAGDLVSARLPSPSAFNHVFVVATVGGERLWLDGTAAGTTLADIDDVLPFHWVLPVRSAGADLLAVPTRVPARAQTITTLDMDLRGGLNVPAPFDAKVTLRGGITAPLRLLAGSLDKEEQGKFLRLFLPSDAHNALITSSDISFDEAAGTATVALSGIASPSWTYRDARYSEQVGSPGEMKLPDRSRAIWKDIPVNTGDPAYRRQVTSVRLPDAGQTFSFEGSPQIDAPLPGGRHLVSKATLGGGKLTVELEQTASGAEIAAADLPAARARLAELQNRRLSVRTAPGDPPPWRAVAIAKRGHLYDPVIARFATYIAARPDDASRYAERARFLTRIFERRQALADLDKAISLQASADYYAERAGLRVALGDKAAAIDDLQAARDLEPGNLGVLTRLTTLMAETGHKDDALAILDQKIGEGGENLPWILSAKASVLARGSTVAEAIQALDKALAEKPNDPALLNSRCWIAGTMNYRLDAALADCNRSIEVSSQSTAAVLDSRAMIYFRQNKLAEALADLNAALLQRPAATGSLFLRGIVEKRLGKTAESAQDLADARLLSPQIDADYAAYGVKP